MSAETNALAVTLVSGGLDSCVATAWAAGRYRLAMLHVNYGQRTEARELECFRRLAEHFRPAHRQVFEAAYLGAMGGSSLTDSGLEIPEDDPPGRIPTTYVPFRNANLLAIATAWAETIGASRLVIGAVQEDAPGYPDCRPAFFEAANRLIELGTCPETHILVETPLIAMSKAKIIRLGVRLHAPLAETWSCYRSGDKPCGRCASCCRRADAFAAAGVADPVTSAT